MILSPGCYRLPRRWQNALLSLTCAGITLFCLIPVAATAQDNIAPTIIGQQPLSVAAGSPLAITLADLQVVDPDNSYPEGFSLRLVENSEAFTLSDNSVIPDVNFEGSLEVTVVVNDGLDDSDPFALTVDVTNTTDNGGNGGGNTNGGGNNGGGNEDEGNNGGGNSGDGDNDDENEGEENNDGGNNGGGNNGDGNNGGGNNGGENNGGGNNGGDGNNGEGNNGEGNNGGGNNGNGNEGEGNNGGGNNGGGNNGDGNNGGGNNGGQNNGGENNGEGNNGGVNTPSNVAPVITGQHDITTAKNVAVVLDLNMLVVDDPDNIYPDDFSILISDGNNFSLDNNRIIPDHNFIGTLEVGVKVNDGIANSNVFALTIAVKEGNIPPQIIGQSPLTTEEEIPISLGLDNLIVFDPDSPYPADFTIQIHKGDHYTAEGSTITPWQNISGSLTVMVTVNDGRLASVPYPLIINVTPVNDAPIIQNVEQEVLRYFANAGPANLTERIQVTDVDGDNIVGAEIYFDMSTYHSMHDVLHYDGTKQENLSIEAVFDAERGTLFLIGSASASDYQIALRSVTYSFSHEDMKSVSDATKTLYFVVRDSESESNVVTRQIDFSGEIALDVPQAFTPNGDMANDTWSVTPLQNADDYTDAVTRVYNIRGQLLYEANGFEWQWDGRHQGQYLPSDTYYYVISINSGVNLSNRKGIVTILR